MKHDIEEINDNSCIAHGFSYPNCSSLFLTYRFPHEPRLSPNTVSFNSVTDINDQHEMKHDYFGERLVDCHFFLR